MELLTPLDDVFVNLEMTNLPMHIGGLLVFEGPAPEYQEVVDLVSARLDGLPRYRQVIRSMPLQLGPAVWLDDQHFHLPYHIRHTALPGPGSDEQLRALAGRVLSTRLDLHRPPWEMWLVEGLPEGRWALINKVHHSMVDGISGADIMEVLLDTTTASPQPEPTPWEPSPWPNSLQLLASSWLGAIHQPWDRIRHLGSRLEVPAKAATAIAAAALGTVRLGRELAHTEDHLLGSPGPHRRWAWALGDLGQVKDIKNTLGGTVNDVILTAVTGGFRQYLLGRGVELTEDDSIRTMVPVSTRKPGAAPGGNQVSVLFTDLPVGVADPAERFAVVRERMTEVKASGLLQGVDALIHNAVFIPPALLTAAGKLAAHAPQPSVSTITTNVPGPQQPLYLLGHELLRLVPYVPLGMNQLITIAIISYNGQINCGITADYDRVPDVTVVAEGIEASLAELAALAGEA